MTVQPPKNSISPTSPIGNLPNHWRYVKLKRWVSINEKTLPDNTDPNHRFHYLEIGAVGHGSLAEKPKLMAFREAPSRARRIVRQGDTIVSTVRTYLKAVWFAETATDLVCSTGFAVLSPRRETVPKFVTYLAQSEPFIQRVTANSVGTSYPAIPETKFADIEVPVPPAEEQAAIVRYLDHADDCINRYISAKERLIALLQEQRQAVIHQAVTRGLDPNVRLKPSAVEWLGDVPAHWEVRRLKTVLQPIDRRSVTGSETLLSLRRDHGVVAYDEHFTRPSQSRSLVGYKLVTTGQLVLNRLQANNGLIFNSNLDGLVSPDYSVFENKSPLRMQFVSDLLRTIPYRTHFRQRSTGLGTGTAGFLRLYDDKFLETKVHLPPVQEQVAIIEHINQADANINAAISHARRQVDLLREYRTRLIADAVTGQIDVRDAAIDLPN